MSSKTKNVFLDRCISKNIFEIDRIIDLKICNGLLNFSCSYQVLPSEFLANISGRIPQEVVLGHRYLAQQCIIFENCFGAEAERYRRIDGTCNNLQHALLGSADSPFSRWLPPHYDDGLHFLHIFL